MELKKYKLGEIADFNKENIGSTDKFTVIEYLDCKKRSRLLQQKRRCCYSSDVAKLMFSS